MLRLRARGRLLLGGLLRLALRVLPPPLLVVRLAPPSCVTRSPHWAGARKWQGQSPNPNGAPKAEKHAHRTVLALRWQGRGPHPKGCAAQAAVPWQ